MEDPAAAGIDRYGGVTAGVARQTNQHDAGRDVGELLGRGKVTPAIAVGERVLDQGGIVVALGLLVARPLR